MKIPEVPCLPFGCPSLSQSLLESQLDVLHHF